VFTASRENNPQSPKKRKNAKKNGNASLSFVNLHLYADIGSKRATLMHLFYDQGFRAIF
jgi:hypothetical protein